MNRSTYRLHKTRRPSDREVRRILLADTVRELHTASRATYGTRRMQAAVGVQVIPHLHEQVVQVIPQSSFT